LKDPQDKETRISSLKSKEKFRNGEEVHKKGDKQSRKKFSDADTLGRGRRASPKPQMGEGLGDTKEIKPKDARKHQARQDKPVRNTGPSYLHEANWT
jgi:hypothetical protein